MGKDKDEFVEEAKETIANPKKSGEVFMAEISHLDKD